MNKFEEPQYCIAGDDKEALHVSNMRKKTLGDVGAFIETYRERFKCVPNIVGASAYQAYRRETGKDHMVFRVA